MNEDIEVLQELRVGVELDAEYDPQAQSKLAAIDSAIAALTFRDKVKAWMVKSGPIKTVSGKDVYSFMAVTDRGGGLDAAIKETLR